VTGFQAGAADAACATAGAADRKNVARRVTAENDRRATATILRLYLQGKWQSTQTDAEIDFVRGADKLLPYVAAQEALF
jgi:hypothetical protein